MTARAWRWLLFIVVAFLVLLSLALSDWAQAGRITVKDCTCSAAGRSWPCEVQYVHYDMRWIKSFACTPR